MIFQIDKTTTGRNHPRREEFSEIKRKLLKEFDRERK